MDVAVNVTGAEVAEELRSLHSWLADDSELRGRVRLVERAPDQGVLGTIPEVLAITLGPGAGGTAMAVAVIAWMRYRTSDVGCKLTRPDGTSIEVSAKRVRGSDLPAQQQIVRELSAALSHDAASGGATTEAGETP